MALSKLSTRLEASHKCSSQAEQHRDRGIEKRAFFLSAQPFDRPIMQTLNAGVHKQVPFAMTLLVPAGT